MAKLWERLLNWFLGWLAETFRQEGRDEVITEVEKKHDEVTARHDEIDARPPDARSALERMRAARLAEDARRAARDKGRDDS